MNRIVSGETAPPVISMLIACSIVRSVSVTRSMRQNLQQRRSRIDGIRQQHRRQQLARRLVGQRPRQEANALLPHNREIHQHHPLARLLLHHHAVNQLPHRPVYLGHKRQPLQRCLKQPQRLPAHHQRRHPTHHVQHGQRQHHRQHRPQPRRIQPVSGKQVPQQPQHRLTRRGQRPQQEAENEVGHKQRSNRDHAGENIPLQAARSAGKNWIHKPLLPSV